MKRKLVSVIAVVAMVALYLCWRQAILPVEKAVSSKGSTLVRANQSRVDRPHSSRQRDALGDILTDAQDPVFLNEIFPKVRDFFATLDRLKVNPLQDELQPGSCSKVRIINIPDGIICRFVIGGSWTATYMQTPAYSGMMHFGQRGPDNPYRAISSANTNALHRLSREAITMSETDVWRIVNGVADAFGIDSSKFEKAQMHEEGLFEYRLGIYTVRYLKKGSDPVNQLNYIRELSLKATSPTTAVLVSYSHLEAP